MKMINQLFLGLILTNPWGFTTSPIPSTATSQVIGESGKAIQRRGGRDGSRWFSQWYTQSSVQTIAANWTPKPHRYQTASLTSITNAVSRPAPVTVAFVPTVEHSDADLIGPNQVHQNTVQTFEVNPSKLVNATNFSWWNTGSTKSITAIQLGKASINFGPNYAGGKVCVGINYSVSPRYRQYCKNVSPRSPDVALISPANSATFVHAATIALAADVGNDSHAIARVEYFSGSTKLGESTTFPHSISWSDVVAGTHTLTAKATDKLGLTTISAPVTIQVKSHPSVSTDDLVNAIVFPNPTRNHFLFTTAHDIQSVIVMDHLGRERLKLGAAKAGQTVSFGEQLSSGTYLLYIQYSTQHRRVIKLLKTNY